MNTAERYEKGHSIREKVNKTFVPKLASFMTWDFSGGNILNYGSRSGHTGFNLLLPYAEDTDSKLYSVDASQVMTEYGQEHFPHERIQYDVGDILEDDFPLGDIEFDRIFAINAFHFVHQIKDALSKFSPLLKPGGQLGFTMTTVKTCCFQILKELANSEQWGEYMIGYEEHFAEWSALKMAEDPKEHFENIFTTAGFNIQHFEFTQHEMLHDADPILDACMATNPCLEAVPVDMHRELRQEYRRLITEILGVGENEEQYKFPFDYLSVVLEKP